MTQKTVILTEIIAPYRIPVFNALAHRDAVDLHVIFLAETDKALRQWRIYTDEIRFSYEVLPSWRWRAGKHSLLVNRGLWSALGAANPQAILCGGYNHPASWEALWWARRRNVRFVLWAESNQRDNRSGRAAVEWLKRYFVSSCNAFVVPGKSSLAYLRTLGAGEPAIFTAPNAVDNTFFASQAEEVKRQPHAFRERFGLPRRFLLFVGRLVPEKGVFDLLHAYAKLGSDLRSEVGLVFAGDGASRKALSEQAKLIDKGTICFPGFVQREELAPAGDPADHDEEDAADDSADTAEHRRDGPRLADHPALEHADAVGGQRVGERGEPERRGEEEVDAEPPGEAEDRTGERPGVVGHRDRGDEQEVGHRVEDTQVREHRRLEDEQGDDDEDESDAAQTHEPMVTRLGARRSGRGTAGPSRSRGRRG